MIQLLVDSEDPHGHSLVSWETKIKGIKDPHSISCIHDTFSKYSYHYLDYGDIPMDNNNELCCDLPHSDLYHASPKPTLHPQICTSQWLKISVYHLEWRQWVCCITILLRVPLLPFISSHSFVPLRLLVIQPKIGRGHDLFWANLGYNSPCS